MKANELMIGDYVMVNDIEHTHPLQVTELFMKSGTLYATLYWDGMPEDAMPETLTADVDKVLPIPLTPEILEKNGWVRTKYCYGRDCMEIHGADELPEGVDNALSMARWSIDENYQYHFLDLYMWKGSVMQHDVHYVHQLQHAFRIFGIEKEIIL